MGRRMILTMVLVLFVTLCGFSQTMTEDERQIRELIPKISEMWTSPQGALIAEQIFSTHFINLAPAGIMTKQDYKNLISSMYVNNQPQSHRHTIYKIVLQGGYAYEYGLVELVMKNGQVVKNEVINILCRENNQWKILTSLLQRPIGEVLAK